MVKWTTTCFKVVDRQPGSS